MLWYASTLTNKTNIKIAEFLSWLWSLTIVVWISWNSVKTWDSRWCWHSTNNVSLYERCERILLLEESFWSMFSFRNLFWSEILFVVVIDDLSIFVVVIDEFVVVIDDLLMFVVVIDDLWLTLMFERILRFDLWSCFWNRTSLISFIFCFIKLKIRYWLVSSYLKRMHFSTLSFEILRWAREVVLYSTLSTIRRWLKSSFSFFQTW